MWTKGIYLVAEVVNSARDLEGDPLPVVVSVVCSPAHAASTRGHWLAPGRWMAARPLCELPLSRVNIYHAHLLLNFLFTLIPPGSLQVILTHVTSCMTRLFALKLKLELMQGSKPVWTVPGSLDPGAADFSGGIVKAEMPRFQPEDGLYYLRATSLLHHQAFDVSPEFSVITCCCCRWWRWWCWHCGCSLTATYHFDH